VLDVKAKSSPVFPRCFFGVASCVEVLEIVNRIRAALPKRHDMVKLVRRQPIARNPALVALAPAAAAARDNRADFGQAQAPIAAGARQ
jgi:hypothetical protein